MLRKRVAPVEPKPSSTDNESDPKYQRFSRHLQGCAASDRSFNLTNLFQLFLPGKAADLLLRQFRRIRTNFFSLRVISFLKSFSEQRTQLLPLRRHPGSGFLGQPLFILCTSLLCLPARSKSQLFLPPVRTNSMNQMARPVIIQSI